jgi:hypothetical protein
MSLEHLKVVAFLFRRQLVQYERQQGIQVPIPTDVLNRLEIGPEDWRGFWEAER